MGLSHYRPIYFLVGKPHTKIQISFKTQIIESVPVYFAYTQLMMWDILHPSPFFFDLNYNPLFFYRFTIDESKKQWVDLIPLEHESNGRGGVGERSWDRAGLLYHFSRTAWGHDSKTPTLFNASLKAWVPIRHNENNKNLLRYRGLWQIELGLSNFMGERYDFNDLVFRLFSGGKSFMDPTRGGQELTYRLQVRSFKFLPLFVLQLFHGYAESLQDYSVNKWEFRLGLGF